MSTRSSCFGGGAEDGAGTARHHQVQLNAAAERVTAGLALAHRFSRVAAAFEDPQVEAVFSNLDYVPQADTRKVVRHWATGPYSAARLKRGWMPAHPTLNLRRSVYERLDGFDTSFRIAADYDFVLRYFSQATGRSVYIPEVLYKMRLGGVSNRNFARIHEKMGEDWHAIRGNKVGGVMTIASKNFSKLGQFLERQKG